MSARAWRRRRDAKIRQREDLRILNTYGLGEFLRTLGKREQQRHRWLGLPPCSDRTAVFVDDSVFRKA